MSGLSRGLGFTVCYRRSTGGHLFAWTFPSLRSEPGLVTTSKACPVHEMISMNHGLPCKHSLPWAVEPLGTQPGALLFYNTGSASFHVTVLGRKSTGEELGNQQAYGMDLWGSTPMGIIM